jgi:Associated with zinc fingers
MSNGPKIPPFYIPGSAWRIIAPKLMTTVPSGALQVKVFNSNSIKLQCIDSELYRIVQKYLQKTNTEYHTVPFQSERALKVVIKGLLADITEKEVLEELTNKGFSVRSVRQFGNATRKFPIHLIILDSNPSNKEIFNLTDLFYIAIKVESFASKNPAQCYSCQRFGHSSLHCGYPPRCVKCSGGHLAKDCSKNIEEPPTCANCNGSHTANFKNCPSLQQEKEARRPNRPNTANKPKTQFPTLPSTLQQPPSQAHP